MDEVGCSFQRYQMLDSMASAFETVNIVPLRIVSSISLVSRNILLLIRIQTMEKQLDSKE